MDIDQFGDHAHEEILQAAIRHLLTTDDLDQICAQAGIPALLDDTGQPVTITAAHSYRDAGVLTLDRGVWLELSDGSRFGLTLTVSARPEVEVTVGPPERPHRSGRGPLRPRPRPADRRAPGPCGCVCSSGGFCGGCGHAGCGRR
jgi:hypothetical protein